MSVYNRFPHDFIKVPVQFGGLSKRPRKCRCIGTLGSMFKENWAEDYYRIDDAEISSGRFFCTRTWRGDKEGELDSNGRVWHYTTYIQYAHLPSEIKQIIKERKENK